MRQVIVKHARLLKQGVVIPVVAGLSVAGLLAMYLLPGLEPGARDEAIASLHLAALNVALGLSLWRLALGPAVITLILAIKHAAEGDKDDEQ